ncbi:unnamed protein product [Hermetia illucens]|uniref:Integrator complex subunit 14 n=2 Tax=Hermetia illucens TaxID=343691 RepID=A0A7R8YQM0_HERIL|nr:unnamed protein product [Hermetia illucens]
MQYEVLVDFTRDYDLIRQALKKVEHFDKTHLESMLKGVSNILASNWGTQNFCQILAFTDCGMGFGKTALRQTIANVTSNRHDPEYVWLSFLSSSRLTFICLGNLNDDYFALAIKQYQQFLDISDQKGQLFIPAVREDSNKADKSGDLDYNTVTEMVERMCENNFKPFEATLKCGSYHKLECSVLMWPPPVPYKSKDLLGKETIQMISKKIDICGFLKLSDIGSPVSVSRHLIVPKMEGEKSTKKGEKGSSAESPASSNEFEKLENEIRQFYAKGDSGNSDDEDGKSSSSAESNKESFCVLLHGALKVESMAALVLLNDNWFGFIHSYADSKKKSNLMLNILQPGNDVIPWLGDLRYLSTIDDALPGEYPSFPVKADKRSYTQNCVVWIKQAGLQSDIQKVLRHAKKMPEKTPHFYKELNRIRRAALSLGFIELLEGLANIFDRESTVLPSNANPDCAIQLKHAANELRKITNRDIKTLITALPTKYNQL